MASRKRSREQRTDSRVRNMTPGERSQSFISSIRRSSEFRMLTGTGNSPTERERRYLMSDLPDVERPIGYYRFEGVLVERDMVSDRNAKRGMIISDIPDRWPLIDKLNRAISELNRALARRHKGKPQRRDIEQLVAQIEAPISQPLAV